MKRILITGASRGIGAAVARELAGRGASLALHCNRSVARAEDLRAALPGEGHTVVVADLGDPGAVAGLYSEATSALGGLDGLVNNAGIYEEHPLLDVDLDTWRDHFRRTLQVNLLAAADLTYLACRHFADSGGGRIVQISSRGAFRGEPTSPAYAASKAGLNAMSQSLARALGSRGVLFFVVAPGWVRTDMATAHVDGALGEKILDQIPLGRIAEPEEIATTVAFCLTDAPASMTGTIIDVNGASHLR